MSEFIRESIQVLKDGISSRTPMPEVGSLLRIVHAVNSGNSEIAQHVAESLDGSLSEATKRAFVQWLGSNKYQSVAISALSSAPSFIDEACCMLQDVQNQSKRAGLIKIINSSDIGREYLSANLQALQRDEQDLILKSWVSSRDMRADLMAIQSVANDNRLTERLVNLYKAEEQSDSVKRFNRLVEYALGANDEFSKTILKFADSIYSSLNYHLRTQYSPDVSYLMDEVLSSSVKFDNEIVEFCINKTHRYPESLKVRAVTDSSISDKSRKRLVSDLSPEALTREAVKSLADQYFCGTHDQVITVFAKRCYSDALLLDWTPPGLKSIVGSSLESSPYLEDSKVNALVSKVDRGIFDCDNESKIKRISNALASNHKHLADLALMELNTLDEDSKIEALRGALSQDIYMPHYSQLMVEFLYSDSYKAIEFSVGMTKSSSSRLKEVNEDFLISVCNTSRGYRDLVRSVYKAANREPSEWGLRKHCSIGVCYIEEILGSTDLSNENYAFVPSQIVGDPKHLNDRGFKFGFLWSKDSSLIQVQLPVSYSKDVVVGTHYVLCTDDPIPLARIYPDPKQDGESLVFEPFPYSAEEVTVKGSDAEKLKKEWLTTTEDSVPAPYLSQELRLRHRRVVVNKNNTPSHSSNIEPGIVRKGIEESSYQSFLTIKEALLEIMRQRQRQGHYIRHRR